MRVYKTGEVARIIGIHSNTVRLYKELGLIPVVKRQPNGYRVFTDFHIDQFKLARLAFQIEVLQNGLRQKTIEMLKISAKGDFDTALSITNEYLELVSIERRNAEEAIEIVKQILSDKADENTRFFKRKEVSNYLGISMDTLRNWEMNGLLTIKRKQNGYRVYTDKDIRYLKIIRSLRCANYSLASILRMLGQLSKNPDIDIKEVLDTPKETEDIITVCDNLITSLSHAENNASKMIAMLQNMKASNYEF